ncbi:GNAT family N-acetyltransferase [Asticcacaulis endophyticus]|uniref:N-acetyltransferase domain-containing protein n=1 Tax=Asticcacaulis endophyticus TaxID=1395890 RepID=A0A918ULZ6_9CAUL|nr:GNAT family N-acetyltransferase [Asticcacaulis endophyticus]GGZ20184.1 hypothetical protein GCM10011273_00920 [Asticcacaulis endophyticus]
MISFRPLTDNDAGLLLLWMTSPHVQQWWLSDCQTAEDGVEDALAYIGAANATAFMITYSDQPIGYFQCYECNPDHEPDSPCYSENPRGTFLFDMFIGDASHLGDGLGAKVLNKAADGLFYKGAQCLRAAPHATNIAAVKSCERAGFTATDHTRANGLVLMVRARDVAPDAVKSA